MHQSRPCILSDHCYSCGRKAPVLIHGVALHIPPAIGRHKCLRTHRRERVWERDILSRIADCCTHPLVPLKPQSAWCTRAGDNEPPGPTSIQQKLTQDNRIITRNACRELTSSRWRPQRQSRTYSCCGCAMGCSQACVVIHSLLSPSRRFMPAMGSACACVSGKLVQKVPSSIGQGLGRKVQQRLGDFLKVINFVDRACECAGFD